MREVSIMRHSETTAAFYKAFCAAQAKVGGAVKEARNDHFNRTYADLASVWTACKVGLSEHGIGVIQALEPVEGLGLSCVTRLVHGESGEWIESALPLLILKNDMQGLGSAFTYAKRYTLSGMIGVWTEDDDGEASVGRGTPARREEKQRPVVEDRRAINDQFPARREDSTSPSEAWASVLARRVREVNQEWRNELAIENVPLEIRSDLVSQEEVINGLVKRFLASDPPLLTLEEVSTNEKRDLTKAKAALVRIHREKPRKMLATLEKYLGDKVEAGRERLARAKADEPRDVIREDDDLTEVLAN